MDTPLDASQSFESATVTFFIIFLLCFICIFLLLAFFIYKCFQDKKDEVTGKSPCADGGADCSPSAADEETYDAGDHEKIIVQIMDSDEPVRPGILVQRQNKDTSLGSTEDTETEQEDKTKGRQAGEVNQKGDNFNKTLRSSVTESQKRPLKGVTFSKEVIVVDLGNEHPAPHRYTIKHKERTRSTKRKR
ncbi:uncharacterized protein C2orf74 homolog [Cavia porcellus]|uniref:uncharacterized protein C2orf74 homolog n=1 Tax=Cavia porcellus TaxID=10141 RepID=UPI0003514026